MGVVYKARDHRLERAVALKFLPAQWSHDEDAKKRFMREAQAASATEHPSICTIHGIDQAADGQLFIVMAYYEGVTLKQRLEDGPLPLEEALEIATQLAQGLARAHRAGVVHRDIKPSNLILTDAAVKIVDFGLAKFADSLHLTVAAAPLGTYAYMSPEQVRAEEATVQSDVWSAGVVLYEMLTGGPPFHGVYFEAIAHAIRHESPAPIRASRPDVPEAVERVVFRAMHKDAAVRYGDGRELALALLQARGLSAPVDLRSGVVEVPQRAAGRQPPEARRRWPVVAAVAALIVAVAATAVWRSSRPPEPRETISVVPVVNQTGYQELAPYRLALTYALIQELAESTRVRPLDYGRVTQFVGPALDNGADVSNHEVQRALAAQGRSRWTIVPTLLHENGAWRARAEVQDAATGSTVAQLETEAVASSLTKDAAYSRIVALAGLIERHFASQGSGAPAAGAPPQRPPADARRRPGSRVGADGDGAPGVRGRPRGLRAGRHARRPASAATGVAEPRRTVAAPHRRGRGGSRSRRPAGDRRHARFRRPGVACGVGHGAPGLPRSRGALPGTGRAVSRRAAVAGRTGVLLRAAGPLGRRRGDLSARPWDGAGVAPVRSRSLPAVCAPRRSVTRPRARPAGDRAVSRDGLPQRRSAGAFVRGRHPASGRCRGAQPGAGRQLRRAGRVRRPGREIQRGARPPVRCGGLGRRRPRGRSREFVGTCPGRRPRDGQRRPGSRRADEPGRCVRSPGTPAPEPAGTTSKA